MAKETPNPKGGPITPAGKAVSSRNATKHGLRATTPVIPGLESAEEWEAHRTGILDSLQPVGRLEFVFAERIALLLWRMQRVTRFESEMLAVTQSRRPAPVPYDSDSHIPVWSSESRDTKTLPTAAAVLGLLRTLPSLQDNKGLKVPFVTAALHIVAEQAGIDIEDRRTIPFFSANGPSQSNCPVAWLRQSIEAAAKQTGRDTEELRQAAIGHLTALVPAARPLQPHGLFSEEPVYEKVVRYEAHLNRQLRSAMQDLEVLQARRRGAATPLTRIDVTGLPEK